MQPLLILAVFLLGILTALAAGRLRRRSRRAPSDIQTEYDQLLDMMPVYFYVEDVNDGFRHIKCNRICAELWGRPVEEVLGKSDEELFGDGEEVRHFRETDRLAAKSTDLREDILPFTGRDGQKRIGHFYRRGVKLPGGRHWLFGIVVDVTDEISQRARLDAMLNAFEYTFDLTQTAVFRLDTETLEMTGAQNLGKLWPIRNGISLSWDKVIHHDDLPRFTQQRTQLLAGKIDRMVIDYRSTAFGELRYYRLEAGLDRTTAWNRASIVGIIQDVTEDKRQEAEHREDLRHQNAILNAILSSIPSQVFIKDINDGFRYKLANRNFTDYYHTTPGAVCGHTDFEIFPPDVAKQLRAHDTAVCAAPGRPFRFNENISYRQGGAETFTSLKVRFEAEGGHSYLLGVCIDITEQERAKHRAENTAEWLRLTLNSIGDGVLTTDVSGNIFLLNPVAERMTGISLAEAKGKPHEQIFHIVSSIDELPMPSPITRAIRTGNTVELANHTDLISANGKRYHIADSASPIYDAHHKILGAILVFRDVTEEYLQRDMLRTANAQLEMGAELTQSATFRIDPKTRQISGSPLLSKLWPILPDGTAIPIERWVTPEDLPAFKRVWKSLFTNDTDRKTCSYRANTPQGLRHYRVNLMPDHTDSHRLMLFGVVQDVTEIQESAARLKATQELWEQIINSIPTILFAKDAGNGFRYVLCNQACADFFGRPLAEIIGKTDEELFHSPQEAARSSEIDRRIIRTGQSERVDTSMTDASGTSHNIRSYKRPLASPNNTQLLLGVVTDVTELHALLQYEQISNDILTYVVSEPSFPAVINKVLSSMLSSLKCGHVIYAACGRDSRLHYFKGVHSETGIPLETAGLANHEAMWNARLAQFRANESITYDDFTDIPEVQPLLKEHPGYTTRSLAAVPVLVGDELTGILLATYTERHTFTVLDKKALRAIASIIALAQIRERQHRAVNLAEKRNQTILDNLGIPVWLFDRSGIIIQTNHAADLMIGDRTVKHIPNGCKQVFTCSQSTNQCPVHKCLESGEPQQISYLHTDGREYLADTRPILGENGKPSSAIMSFVDVTPLKHLLGNQKLVNDCLATLLRKNDMVNALGLALKSICKHSDVDRCYIVRFETEGLRHPSFMAYVRASDLLNDCHDQSYPVAPTWQEYFKREPVVAIPDLRANIAAEGLEPWRELIESTDSRSLYAHRIYFGGKLWGFIGMIYEKRPRRLDTDGLAFLGSVAYCVELMLTRQRNQREILAAAEKAKAADRAKSMFLASMSHEIRTPLNAVIGFAELLRDGSLPPDEQHEYIANIATAGNALLSLINDVLDLSKLEAGQLLITPAPVDFPALLQEMDSIFKQRCSERGLAFAFDIQPGLPTVWIDRLRIRQVLFNLIGNAVKFTDRGGITVKARFEKKTPETGDFSFSIIDTGCGIAPDDQKRIFQLFVQAASMRGTQKANKGTGLGLAICKRLVEQMNGAIQLSSEPGKGSDFTVILRSIRFSAPGNPAAASQAPAAVPLLGAKCPGNKRRALIVDDVPMNLKVLAAMLAKLGVSTCQAANATEALAALEHEKVDFVLTDMWMPGINGAELATKIHQQARTARLPVFAVTADVEARENFPLDIFSGVFLKPVTVEKLAKFLSQLV